MWPYTWNPRRPRLLHNLTSVQRKVTARRVIGPDFRHLTGDFNACLKIRTASCGQSQRLGHDIHVGIHRNQQLRRSDAAPDTKVYRTPLTHHPTQEHVKTFVGRCAAGYGNAVHTVKLTAQVQNALLKRFTRHKQFLKTLHARVDIGQSLAQYAEIGPLIEPVETPLVAQVTPRLGYDEAVRTTRSVHHTVHPVKNAQEHLAAAVSHPRRYEGRYLYVLTAAVAMRELHGITIYE